ncbi:MAG: hypothetical protein KAX65_00160 [Caldilineaceae bacterium]|nr:hypothetical protein [Caldilineaceae bacterium]
MSNSLNFLNKPANSPKPIGPQPKPSTAAPKAFIDKSNPWAVGGGTPTASSRAPRPRTQTPATRPTPAPVASSARAPAQAAPRSTPEPRQATPARAPARPLPTPAVIQTVTPRPIPAPAPASPWQTTPYIDPYLAQQQGADYLNNRPAPAVGITDPYIRQQQRGAPPQPGYNPLAGLAPPLQPSYNPLPQNAPARPTPAPTPAQPWQMAPTAEQAMAVRPQPAPGQPAAPIVPTNAWLLDGIQPGQPAAPAARQNAPAQPSYNPLPQGTGTNVPTAPGAPNAPAAGNAQPQARGPFYGYAPPGPLTAPRTVDTQRGQRMPYYMTDRPNVSGWGQRALMTDEALAVEDARRQRDAAGSFGALQASGRYRPWSSYSPAEKYYLRYGVMPEGAQLAPDTSGAEALAANEAQNQRLYDEYWDRYGNVIRGRRWYGGMRPGQEQTMYGSEMAAAMQGRAQGIAPAAPAIQAAPATQYDPLSSANTGQPAATQAAPTAPGAQARINNYSLAQVNPAAVRNGVITDAVTEDDVSVVARQILRRYLPELDADGMNFVDIVAVLAKYVPPQDRAAKYNEDAQWLGGFLSR